MFSLTRNEKDPEFRNSRKFSRNCNLLRKGNPLSIMEFWTHNLYLNFAFGLSASWVYGRSKCRFIALKAKKKINLETLTPTCQEYSLKAKVARGYIMLGDSSEQITWLFGFSSLNSLVLPGDYHGKVSEGSYFPSWSAQSIFIPSRSLFNLQFFFILSLVLASQGWIPLYIYLQRTMRLNNDLEPSPCEPLYGCIMTANRKIIVQSSLGRHGSLGCLLRWRGAAAGGVTQQRHSEHTVCVFDHLLGVLEYHWRFLGGILFGF